MNSQERTLGIIDPVLLPALLVGVLPLLTVNICLWISVQAETVPNCVPYWEGCTSISAAGRNPPAIYLFRGIMLPTAAVLVVFWYLNVRWLGLLEGQAARRRTGVLWLGIIGAVFLGLYVSYLGSTGDFARMMRRYGIFVFFGFTALAHLLAARALLHGATASGEARLARHARAILWLCFVMLVFGLVNVIAKALLPDPDHMENIIEWNFAILMQACFLVYWLAWRHSGLAGRLWLGRDG